jgi:hypothetical protein
MAQPNKTTATTASASGILGSHLVPSHRGHMTVPEANNQTPKGGHDASTPRTTPQAGRRQIPGRRPHRRHLSVPERLEKLALHVEASLPSRPSLMGSAQEPKTRDAGDQNARPCRTGHHRPASCIGQKRPTLWRCGHPAGPPTARDRGALAPNDLSDSKAS